MYFLAHLVWLHNCLRTVVAYYFVKCLVYTYIAWLAMIRAVADGCYFKYGLRYETKRSAIADCTTRRV